MVDVQVSVKGLYTLAAEYEWQAAECADRIKRGEEGLTEQYLEAARAARRCRVKAAELLGDMGVSGDQLTLRGLFNE